MTPTARLYALARRSHCDLDLRDLLILSINHATHALLRRFQP